VHAYNPRRGFALIITITLLAFLVLLLVSLASLTRVETQVAANTQMVVAARQNALLALNMAIGQLQRFAGSDQRITAKADLTKPSAANPHWTGVWGNSSPASALHGSPVLLNWLVSGNEQVSFTADTDASTFGQITAVPGSIPVTPDAALATADAVTLVGATTVGSTSTSRFVSAPLKPIQIPASQLPGFSSGDNTSTTVGHYAWWVGDEGIKARLNVVDPWAPQVATTQGSPAETAFTPTSDQARLRYAVAQRLGIEHVTGLGTTYDVASPSSASTANFRRDLAKISHYSQSVYAGGMDATALQTAFHDLNTDSAGVLSDTLAGGLKKDLTAAFAPGTTTATAPTGAVWTQGSQTGPVWQLLRSYYQLPDASGVTGSGLTLKVPPRAQTDAGVHGISPIVAFYQVYIEGKLIDGGDGTYTLQIRHYPVVVLWNPYNATLTDALYHAEFSFNGIAGVFFARIATSASTAAISANAQAGSPYFYSREGLTNNAGAVRTTAQSALQFTIQSGDLPPGQAFVYTLPADVAYTAVTDYANYRLTRGWHSAGLNALVSSSPGSFSLPALPSGNYTFRTWVGGGGDGGGVIANQNLPLWNEATPSTTTGTVPSLSGSDSFVLRLTNASGGVLQSILRNNTYLRTSATDSTLSGALPASPGTLSLGYFAQKAALKVSDGGNMAALSSAINSPIRWLANYNPRAIYATRSAYENQGSGGHGYFNSNPSFNTITTTVGGKYGRPFDSASAGFPVNFAGTTSAPRAFVGMTQNNWPLTGGDPEVELFDVPRAETRVLSLGALQHVNAYRTSATEALASNTSPAYPIGNSLADPRVGLAAVSFSTSGFATSAVSGTVYDHAYLLNRALWDGYYFSSVPFASSGSTVTFPLPNARHEPYRQDGVEPLATNLRDYAQAAANLLVTGAFNVNSTSVEAWRAVLAGVNNVPVGGTTRAGEAPYPRTLYPPDDTAVLDSATTHASGEALAYRGYRFLTSGQIDALATQMVVQVRARGPFVSLADFVNRALTDNSATATDERLMGALAAAIESAGINQTFTGDKTGLLPDNTGYTNMPAPAAHDGPTATDVPGYVTQADLLQSLGPVLSVRSDTFVIRAYGDMVNPVTQEVNGRAWCEAVVQRIPDYVDRTDSTLAALGAATAPKDTQTINQTFGRRFITKSFRWLSPADI
jgi:hypothetical protein